jgi:tetratricopeptide (TPR) repeat protein
MTRATIRVSILIAAGVTAFAQVSDEAKWREYFDAGNRALRDGEYTRARECYTAASQLTQPLPADHPLRALSMAAMGGLEVVRGNEPPAEQLFLEARRIMDKNNMQGSPQYAQILADLGVTKATLRQEREAEALFKQSIALSPQQSVTRAAVISRLASLYASQGRMADALPLFNEALAIERPALPESLHAMMYTLEALGSGWIGQGRYDQATSALREAWQLSRQLSPDHPERAQAEAYLGSALFMQGKPERAVPLLKSAMSIYERSSDGPPDRLGPVLTTLAHVDASEKHYAMAEEKLRRVLDLFEHCHRPGDLAIGFAQGNLAQLYIDQRRYEEARPLIQSSFAIVQAAYPPTHPSVAATLYETARMEAGLLDLEQADTHFRQSILTYQNATDPHDPRLGGMLRTYAAFLKKVHRDAEAKPLEAQAKSILAFQHH